MRSLVRNSKVWLQILALAGLLGGLLVGTVMAGGVSLSMASVLNEVYVQAYNQNNLIRFHVIANSDTVRDQALKRRVRDLIVQELTPSFSKAKNIDEAREIARDHLAVIEKLAGAEVRKWGKDYKVKAVLGRHSFPTKSYGSFTLPAGEYEAVRVVIGKGAGANWWCVLFPPLCFGDLSKSLGAAAHLEPAAAEEQEPELLPVLKPETGKKVWRKPVTNSDSTDIEPETRYEVKFRFLEIFREWF